MKHTISQQEQSIRDTAMQLAIQLNRLSDANLKAGRGMYNSVLQYLEEICQASHTQETIRATIDDLQKDWNMGILEKADYEKRISELRGQLV